MTLAVTGQEGHPPAFERSDDVGPGRFAERRAQPDFAFIFEAVDLVEPRSAQDADRRTRWLGFFGPGHESSLASYTFFREGESTPACPAGFRLSGVNSGP